ncbi:MAG: DUF5625 family protein [Pseudomonadota bacterium]
MKDYYRPILLWIFAFLIVSSISTNAYCETAAVSLDQPGPIFKMEFRRHTCNVILMELTFSTAQISREEEVQLIGNGSYQADTKELINPGITVPLRIRVVKIESKLLGQAKEREIRSWECKTQGISSFSPGPERSVSRSAGSITLPRGKYRIEVSLLEPVTALKDIPAYFGFGSSFKISPNREDCR